MWAMTDTQPESASDTKFTASSISSTPVHEYLARLAARRPTPAGGAAAAVTAAQAAALLAMSARVTRSRMSTGSRLRPMLTRLIEQADDRRGLLLDLGDADSRAFDRVLAVARGSQEASWAELMAAYRPVIEIPLTVVDACLEILQGVSALAPVCHPPLAGDAEAAAHLARAAAVISLGNARINVAALRNLAPRSPDPTSAGCIELGRDADAFADTMAQRLREAETKVDAAFRPATTGSMNADAPGSGAAS